MPEVERVSRLQLWTLMSLVVVIPFSFELIFPFINQFLLEIGVIHSPADAGYYSGLAEGAFAVAQLVTVFPAAWISDVYGRKPVLIIGAAGVGISMGLFGFSTKFWMILAFRILGGAVAGSRTIYRVIGTEMAHSRDEETWIFTLITIVYRIGQVTGQPVGALLSHPERRWPKYFGYPFWRMYPYALPGLVGAVYALITALIAQVILKETLASKQPRKNLRLGGNANTASATEETPLLADSSNDSQSFADADRDVRINANNRIPPTADPSSSFLSILTRPLISVFLSAFGTAIITEIFHAVYPLFAFTPVELGGLGLSEARIGVQLSVRAVLFIVSLFIYTPVWRRIGRMETHRLSILMWLPTAALFPVLNWVARGHAGGEDGLFWYLISFVIFAMWSITGWVWPSMYLLASEHTPDPKWNATVQACLQVAIIVALALGPAIGGTLFAFSVKHRHLLDGYFFWVIILTFISLLFAHSFTLEEVAENSNPASNATTTSREDVREEPV